MPFFCSSKKAFDPAIIRMDLRYGMYGMYGFGCMDGRFFSSLFVILLFSTSFQKCTPLPCTHLPLTLPTPSCFSLPSFDLLLPTPLMCHPLFFLVFSLTLTIVHSSHKPHTQHKHHSQFTLTNRCPSIGKGAEKKKKREREEREGKRKGRRNHA